MAVVTERQVGLMTSDDMVQSVVALMQEMGGEDLQKAGEILGSMADDPTETASEITAALDDLDDCEDATAEQVGEALGAILRSVFA